VTLRNNTQGRGRTLVESGAGLAVLALDKRFNYTKLSGRQ